MSPWLHEFVSLDLMPLLAGTLAALTCGLLGNFLVLRRLSLMGDAISHSVLPGLVGAFLVLGTRSTPAMFVGAALAGVATVALVELVKRLGRVEPGAAMGVVFSALFALGVLMLESAAARQVDLDADCVLHGQLETLFWLPPAGWGEFLSWSTLRETPRQVVTLAATLGAAAAFVALFFKELRIAAFDPGLATTQGFSAGFMHYALMILVAAATVAAFEAVGSILVIAMLVCPAATARLLTDRLSTQIWMSLGIALATGVGGYLCATAAPAWLGADAVSVSGMMTVVAGGLLALAAVFSPSHGIVARGVRRRALARSIEVDDLLGALYRLREGGESGAPASSLAAALGGRSAARAIVTARGRGLVEERDGGVSLTALGLDAARAIVRRHRLWESYLVEEAGAAPEHVHAPAERLEHVRVSPRGAGGRDPHGRRIPDGPEET